MLEARPIVVNPGNIVLGGNMRLKACKAAGLKEAPVYVASWEESKANAFIIKDNVGFWGVGLGYPRERMGRNRTRRMGA